MSRSRINTKYQAANLDDPETGNKKDKQQWDKFDELPPEDDSYELSRCIKITIKCLKIITCIIVFFLILGGTVISKTTFLLIASMINNRPRTYCRNEWDKNHQYQSLISQEERMAWIWCLAFTFIIPEIMSFARSLRICYFKPRSIEKPDPKDFLVVAFFETLYALGMSLLLFVVLPYMNVINGAMLMNTACFIPSFLNLICRANDKNKTNKVIKILLDFLAILIQLTGLVFWTFISQSEGRSDPKREWTGHDWPWAIPVSMFFISCGWWENYVNGESSIQIIQRLAHVRKTLKITRYPTYACISLLKLVVFFTSMLGFLFMTKVDVSDLFSNFTSGFRVNKILFIHNTASIGYYDQQVKPYADDLLYLDSVANVPVYICLVQILVTYFTYIMAKFACRILIQVAGFAIPINLTMPLTISILIVMCGRRSDSPCFLSSLFPKYIYWECPNVSFWNIVTVHHYWIWLFWLLSQIWITLHIWTPINMRLGKTEAVFVTPMYSGPLIDQSLALNRRITPEEYEMDKSSAHNRSEEHEKDVEKSDEEMEDYYENPQDLSKMTPGKKRKYSEDNITRIYGCATMWHETEDEMKAMLKSVLRMDSDQSTYKLAKKHLGVASPSDYYELEMHVFFDDAFTLEKNSDTNVVCNKYVKYLMESLKEAACSVHEIDKEFMCIPPPDIYFTPYGGRLVWTLPGKTPLIVHLKDKENIRHRKRWSQVMYMYYFLGHRLMERNIDKDRKDVIAQNTYLLALDGDIDFQPDAVRLLVDLMKKDQNLGAACGRIHPIGSGPMVWYQKFEYAIGHWFQKATEHMIGCVLCSPGCFSLFRGNALMATNVMKRYTTKPTKALHYVQYDQGEDRWLCTLLLQRGFRVEYAAASDAFTHAPEGFGEFFNQRRRWVPSTTANIMDLLLDYKKTVKINNNISMLYITYQAMLMVGTILGPGTILLMLQGATVAAFKVDNATALMVNVAPVLLFIAVCFLAKPDHQILLAGLLTALYALLMMAVVVGTLLQVQEDGIASPGTIFLIAITASFVLAAIMHPYEIGCLLPGLLYYLLVPSMYLLLIIYSIINLYNVTWGTREDPQSKTKQQIEEQQKLIEESKKKESHSQILNLLGIKNEAEMEGGCTINFANLCSFLLCTHPKPKEEQVQLIQINETVKKLDEKLDELNRKSDMSMQQLNSPSSKQNSNMTEAFNEPTEDTPLITEVDGSTSAPSGPEVYEDKRNREYWLGQKELKGGKRLNLREEETIFWKGLLKSYLYPIIENKEEKDKISKDLIDLRNNACLAFFLANAIFDLTIFLLQMNKNNIYIDWPLGAKYDITYIDDNEEVRVGKTFLHLEPVGLVFVFCFALIMIIQFLGMIFHRIVTFSQIMANTQINFGKSKVENSSLLLSKITDNYAIKAVRKLQKLKGVDSNDKDEELVDKNGRRKTVHMLERKHQQKDKKHTYFLEDAFRKRYYSEENSKVTEIFDNLSKNINVKRQLHKRRETSFNQENLKQFQRAKSESRNTSGFINRRESNTDSLCSNIGANEETLF